MYKIEGAYVYRKYRCLRVIRLFDTRAKDSKEGCICTNEETCLNVFGIQ
jgi:hypothetical protein